MKLISFVVPCYHSAAYMRRCIDSLLAAGNDAEIIIVDDGSVKDNTAAVADEYESRYPGMCKVIHQENGGHGEAINTGLSYAAGLYFKVVDSDDWLDQYCLSVVMENLREFYFEETCVDLLICNYVYEHVLDYTSKAIRYGNALPVERVFGWEDIGHFHIQQNLLMHSLIYRTQVLRDCELRLPKHTFYVDNLFAYIPLPYVKSMYYLDLDLYRYFIGRDDQSVNEKVMVGRIDQQICVNNLMIDAYPFTEEKQDNGLTRYMLKYLAMISFVTSVMLIVSGTEENRKKRKRFWSEFKKRNPKLYGRIRWSLPGIISNPPGKCTEAIVKWGYLQARKIFKFN